jgi:hypothetical protein
VLPLSCSGFTMPCSGVDTRVMFFFEMSQRILAAKSIPWISAQPQSIALLNASGIRWKIEWLVIVPNLISLV